MRGDDGIEWHDLARYFMLDKKHIVQCTCGARFIDVTEKATMRKHFQHGVLKMRQGSVPE